MRSGYSVTQIEKFFTKTFVKIKMSHFDKARKAIAKDDFFALLPILANCKPHEKDSEERTLLWHALFPTHRRLCAISLINWGCDINCTNKWEQTPLIFAAECNRAETLKAILKMEPKLDAADVVGNTALYYAVWHCNVEAVEALLQAGCDPRRKNNAAVNCWWPLVTKSVSQFADRANMQGVWDLLKDKIDPTTKLELDDYNRQITTA